jgi:uncharacterized protein with predicted RNA binding PUA domain
MVRRRSVRTDARGATTAAASSRCPLVVVLPALRRFDTLSVRTPELARMTTDAFEDVARARTVAAYQFGAGAGDALFPSDDEYDVKRTSSGRIEQVAVPDGRLVTLGVDGRYTLGIEAGRRLVDGLDDGAYQVTVGDESEPFVRDGENVFAKFVTDADPEIRSYDEVTVVHADSGDLLAVGRAELPAEAMLDFGAGMAVKVRDGVTE